MTRIQFERLKIGSIVLKGKRKAAVISKGPTLVNFEFLDTKRRSCRGYRGLKLVKEANGNDQIRN